MCARVLSVLLILVMGVGLKYNLFHISQQRSEIINEVSVCRGTISRRHKECVGNAFLFQFQKHKTKSAECCNFKVRKPHYGITTYCFYTHITTAGFIDSTKSILCYNCSKSF
jgi:hypothetical protein